MLKVLVAGLMLTVMIAKGQPGQIVYDSLLSNSLANTVTKQNPLRQIAVYLPGDYFNSTKRYPVLYFLHGVDDDPQTFTDDTTHYYNIQSLMKEGVAANKFGEMIIVFPSERTDWFGSFYTNSSATGNWEDFTVKELVQYIDTKYRTIAKTSSRAIAGHSMGGYGSFTLAMKHPDVYSSVYSMNSAFFCFREELAPDTQNMKAFVSAESFRDLLATENFMAIGLLNLARAISPNASNPPLYLDKPFQLKGDQLIKNQPVYDRWVERDVVQMAVKYKSNLLKLRSIQFDSGDKDDSRFIVTNNRLLSAKLKSLSVPHRFEEYDGDHGNKLWGLEGRIYSNMLPFIYKNIGKNE